MKTRLELNIFKSLVDNTYNKFGLRLLVNDSGIYNPLDPNSPLGFCYRYQDPTTKTIAYNIQCSKIGIEDTDFRILMHEYGHIYLAHLDGIQEELDARLYYTIQYHREELVNEINSICGIDFADKLIDRILDDPSVNHSIHNIAMDMEVNSTVLSLDDVNQMESDISSVVMDKYLSQLSNIKDGLINEDDLSDEERAVISSNFDDVMKKAMASNKVKLIHPSRFHLGVDEKGNPIPFPDNLSYPEYLILIVQHLDQFVKLLVSIKMGGNGDTSNITKNDIFDALNNLLDKFKGTSEEYKQGYRDAIQDSMSGGASGSGEGQQSQGGGGQSSGSNSQGQQSQSGAGGSSGSSQGQTSSESSGSGSSSSDYQQGYNDALNDLNAAKDNPGGGGGMKGLDQLMDEAGMSPSDSSSDTADGEQKEGGPSDREPGMPRKGVRSNPLDQKYTDHSSEARKKADDARSSGTVKNRGSFGCGNDGGGNGFREVDKDVDEVDMALDEVIRNLRKRVVKVDVKKDNMKNYNRGIIRTVIAPTVSQNVTLSNDPKIVFLIDISGSMNTGLIDRCLSTIAKSLRKLSRGLKYDIITWNTRLGEHIKNVDPRRPITQVKYGGGTSIANGIKYFKDNYGPEATLVIISDFEDCLDEWNLAESVMDHYTLYGFDYGHRSGSEKINWRNLKVRKFKDD